MGTFSSVPVPLETNADVLTVKITIRGLKLTKVTVCITYSSNCSLHFARNSDDIVNSRT